MTLNSVPHFIYLHSMKSPISIAIIQNDAGSDVKSNLHVLQSMINGIDNADLIALPEVFALRGDDDALRRGAETLDGMIVSSLSEWARNLNAWILCGSILERDGDDIFNTSILLDRNGDIAASYRKIHLFEVRLENNIVIRESDVYSPGDRPVTADVEGWKCGLSICYDLRFPELFRYYSSRGVNVIFAPSNFTQRTGRDHWNILVRARAIENQCFVVAPAQCGLMPGKEIETHGHSMAVGPWGEVLCEAGGKPCVLRAELHSDLLKQTRNRVPALEHRKL